MPKHPLSAIAITLIAGVSLIGSGATAAKPMKANAKQTAPRSTGPGAKAKLFNANGVESGMVVLKPGADGLAGLIKVSGISPGEHGIHIHTTGKCDAPDFTTAGGHLNPDNKQHGLQNPMGSHQGDLPDLIVGPDGSGEGNFIAHSSLAAVFDADGAAFVVHAGKDDGKTDPSGNSGGRLLCGVLKKMGN